MLTSCAAERAGNALLDQRHHHAGRWLENPTRYGRRLEGCGGVRSNRFLQPQIEGVGQAFFEADWDGADHRPASLTRSKELTSFSSTTYESCSDRRIQSSPRSGRCGTFRLRKIRRDKS